MHDAIVQSKTSRTEWLLRERERDRRTPTNVLRLEKVLKSCADTPKSAIIVKSSKHSVRYTSQRVHET